MRRRCSISNRDLEFRAQFDVLQVAAEALDLVDEEVHVVARGGRVLQHQPEEVGPVAQRLVRDHHGARFDHALFDLGSHLPKVDLVTRSGPNALLANFQIVFSSPSRIPKIDLVLLSFSEKYKVTHH